jgi:hypothetical protein
MSERVADSSELFLRSYQLVKMFNVDKLARRSEVATWQQPNTQTQVDSVSGTTLPIKLIPPGSEFKRHLLESRYAMINTYYNDGRVESIRWNINKFTEKSNVMGNLRSRVAFRQGKWQQRGIFHVIVEIKGN